MAFSDIWLNHLVFVPLWNFRRRFCFTRLLLHHSNIHTYLYHLTTKSLWIFAVTVLVALKSSLTDHMKQLSNWNKGDPCRSNWTGVLCFDAVGADGYLHIRELYVIFLFFFFILKWPVNNLYWKVIIILWQGVNYYCFCLIT